MLIHVFVVLLIGVVFIYFGYLIFTEKVPTLLDFFMTQGITYHDKIFNKFFGGIIILIGLIIILLPLILGVDSMNL